MLIPSRANRESTVTMNADNFSENDGDVMTIHNSTTPCTALVAKFTAELLVQQLGPQYVSLAYQVVTSVVYMLIFVVGVLGNVATCVVIIKNRYLHNSTNFYLFSLALSDLMLLLSGIPNEMAMTLGPQYPYLFAPWMCHFRSFISELSPVASILVITAFTVERYLAICYPLSSHQLSTCHRSSLIIALIWLSAVILVTPLAVLTTPKYFVFRGNLTETQRKEFEAASCEVVESTMNNATKYVDFMKSSAPSQWGILDAVPESYLCVPPVKETFVEVYFQVSVFLLYIVPVACIAVLYVLIVKALRNARMAVNMNPYKSNSHKNVIKMLVAVVLLFIICWAPFHLQRLMTIYVNAQPTHFMIIVYYLSGGLFFVSSALNPILYNLMSVRFRRAFITTFCRPCFTPPAIVDTTTRGGGVRVTMMDRSATHSMTNLNYYRSGALLNPAPTTMLVYNNNSHQPSLLIPMSCFNDMNWVQSVGGSSQQQGPHAGATHRRGARAQTSAEEVTTLLRTHVRRDSM